MVIIMKQPERSNKYEDIIHLPHHVSSTRAPMSMEDRAAQFSPFAALTGYEEAVDETGRLTDRRIVPDEDMLIRMSETLQYIAAHLNEQPQITITYFVPDQRKAGGSYTTLTGHVRKLDDFSRTLSFTDGTAISLDQVIAIFPDQDQFL